MTLDELKSRLQKHFADRMVTIVGSGASAALGLPTMADLAEQLQLVIPGLVAPSSLTNWQAISAELDAGTDLESALKAVDIEEQLLSNIVQAVGDFVFEKERLVIEQLVNGKIVFPFSGLLRHIVFATGRAEVITTNYDRLIEFAAELAGYGVDTTFAGTVYGRFDPRLSRDALSQVVPGKGRIAAVRRFRKHVLVLKPHGSLDWYQHNGEPARCWARINAPRLMITPGEGKFRKGYDRPFDYHREQANAAIDSAGRYLVIGYGFNDEQLETHLRPRLSQGYPCLILNRGLTTNADAILKEYSCTAALISGSQHGKTGTVFRQGTTQEFFEGTELWNLDKFISEVLNA